MPYRRAYWYLLALLPLTVLAFWKSYVSKFAMAPFAFHAHGLAGTLWIVLLIAQTWTIHHDQPNIHRQTGLASLVLFPLWMTAGGSISTLMAQKFASHASPLGAIYNPRLALADAAWVGGFAYCYYQALRQRRKVHPHSRYMLSTVLFLLPPIFGRLTRFVPPLRISGPPEFWKFGVDIQLATIATAAIAFYLAWRDPKHGRPFVETGALILLAAVLFQTVGGLASWQQLYSRVAVLPSATLPIAACLAGVVIAYAGWIAGKRPTPWVGIVPV
jgi:hypothetical protein